MATRIERNISTTVYGRGRVYLKKTKKNIKIVIGQQQKIS
jgi:hypothetical protein